MLFKEETSKSERLEVISSILDEYEIIDNYDIIPAVYLKCNSNELLIKKEKLEEKEVKRLIIVDHKDLTNPALRKQKMMRFFITSDSVTLKKENI